VQDQRKTSFALDIHSALMYIRTENLNGATVEQQLVKCSARSDAIFFGSCAGPLQQSRDAIHWLQEALSVHISAIHYLPVKPCVVTTAKILKHTVSFAADVQPRSCFKLLVSSFVAVVTRASSSVYTVRAQARGACTGHVVLSFEYRSPAVGSGCIRLIDERICDITYRLIAAGNLLLGTKVDCVS
jgi:hypothetical protein